MGQAFDRDGNMLGEAYGDTKREVFDKLTEAHSDAHEIRIKSLLDKQGAVTHTAGPWEVDYIVGGGFQVKATANGNKITNVQFAANALLIAAAPDLLDDAHQNDRASTWLAEQMNSITDNAKHWSVAQIEALAQNLRIDIERNQKRSRAAIAKAEAR